MTTVEKMARSDAEFDGRDFDGLRSADKRRYMDRCAKSLKALQEPSELMVLAMAEADHVGVGYGDLFTAAINYAIQEHEG